MTKFFLILFLFISCGVAEAGDFEFAMPQPYKSPDISAKITYCSNGHCETGCEAKMKEAMRLAEKHKEALWSQWAPRAETSPESYSSYSRGYTHIRCITVACLQKELDAAKQAEKNAADLKQAKARWDAIYQECVK